MFLFFRQKKTGALFSSFFAIMYHMQNQPIYDLAIIGGGPAGAAAAVYASRKRLKTVFITKDWLGQSNVSEKVEKKEDKKDDDDWGAIPAFLRRSRLK